jgi:hypothetical protein
LSLFVYGPGHVPPGIQLRGSNIIAELVADDNDVQKSSAISIKNFNEIIDDGTSKSPSSNDEEVTVSSISIINTLFIILQQATRMVTLPTTTREGDFSSTTGT